jgi:hypothetical protein
MVEALRLHGMSFRNQCRHRFSTCSYPCQVHISGGLHTESLTWIHVVNPQRWDPSCATVRRSPVPFAVVTRVSFGLQVKWFSGSSHFETNFESCSQYVWAAQLIKSSAPTVDAMRLTCLTHSPLATISLGLVRGTNPNSRPMFEKSSRNQGTGIGPLSPSIMSCRIWSRCAAVVL